MRLVMAAAGVVVVGVGVEPVVAGEGLEAVGVVEAAEVSAAVGAAEVSVAAGVAEVSVVGQAVCVAGAAEVQLPQASDRALELRRWCRAA